MNPSNSNLLASTFGAMVNTNGKHARLYDGYILKNYLANIFVIKVFVKNNFVKVFS